MKKLITGQLSNKLFLRKVNTKRQSFSLQKNFLMSGANLNFKFIKCLIELELFLGKRPKIQASFVKKSLIINLNTSNNDLEKIILLQKSPVIWKKYLSLFSLFEHYNLPPFLQKKNAIVFSTKTNYYNNWIKSAYLD